MPNRACLREGDDRKVGCSGACVGGPPPDPLESTVSGGQKLLVKEALQVLMIPLEEYFNRDGGLEVPGCWITVMGRQGREE